MQFKFVQATEVDRDYLLQLRKLTMVEHLEKAGLFLTDEQHLMRLDDQYDCSYLIVHNGTTIGTIKYQVSDELVEIMQVQVHPAQQNKGYGKAIIEQVLSDSPDKTVFLTVLKDNPAFKLYQRLGFKVTGEDEYEYHMRVEH